MSVTVHFDPVSGQYFGRDSDTGAIRFIPWEGIWAVFEEYGLDTTPLPPRAAPVETLPGGNEPAALDDETVFGGDE